MKPVAALFVRADSVYFTLPGVDCCLVELARRCTVNREKAAA